MSEFTIDPEFRDLLPPLTSDEFGRLRDDINKNGCRDKLIVWREENILIDGHNRHDICTTLDIPFETDELSFHGRDEVKMWMFKNQLGRRNLTDFQRAEIALRMKPVVEAQAKAKQAAGRPKNDDSEVAENLPQDTSRAPDTRTLVGKIAGVSGKTIDKVEEILEKGSPELIDKARTKDVSIEKAHRIVTGRLPNTTSTPDPSPSAQENQTAQPQLTERQEEGWVKMSQEMFTRIRDYCRRAPAARGKVIRDLKKLARSLES